MTEQLGLVGGPATISPATGKPLRPRQQAAWDLVRSTPGGVTALECGVHIHAWQGHHALSSPCEWCEPDGLQVLRSKALKPLVIRRRSGYWQPRDKRYQQVPAGTEAQRSSQIRDGQLPGDRFEDLFGGAA